MNTKSLRKDKYKFDRLKKEKLLKVEQSDFIALLTSFTINLIEVNGEYFFETFPIVVFIYEKDKFPFPASPYDIYSKNFLCVTLYIRSDETDLLFLDLLCNVSACVTRLSRCWLDYSAGIRSTCLSMSNLIRTIVSKKGF